MEIYVIVSKGYKFVQLNANECLWSTAILENKDFFALIKLQAEEQRQKKALMKGISLAVLHKNKRNNLCELFKTMPEKQELVNTFSLFFCNKRHIFVIEEEPLSRVCRQLHQMMPCMKSQLLVIDKFPNTSKDFSNYLSPLLKLNSCISFRTSLFLRVCVSAFMW